MEQFLFADARWSWILLPVYLSWALLWWLRPRLVEFVARRRAERRTSSAKVPAGAAGAALSYSSLAYPKRAGRSGAVVARRLVSALRLIVVALVLLAVMRPQTGRALTEVSTEGIDIVLIIDTSGSMRALDLDAQERSLSRRRDRLEVSKDVVETFVAARPNDRIGLVVFGGEAFTQCPLTLDHGIATTFLDQLEIGMAGDATAIGSAVGVATRRLKDSEAESKVAILLTDGRSNAGALAPLRAAEAAAALGVKLYAIGVGTRGQAPFIVESRRGPRVVYQDVEIDEDTLRRMATTTGGAYFRAEDVDGLKQIYDEIDELEKTEITQESYMEYEERFAWLVGPAVLLLLLEVVLLDTRLRKLP